MVPFPKFLHTSTRANTPPPPDSLCHRGTGLFSLCFSPDPARVLNMPSVIYAAIGLPGSIRCPVDANPPLTLVKWKKDGLPLRIDKVSCCCATALVPRTLLHLRLEMNASFLLLTVHAVPFSSFYFQCTSLFLI